jgi:hypothetical protein
MPWVQTPVPPKKKKKSNHQPDEDMKHFQDFRKFSQVRQYCFKDNNYFDFNHNKPVSFVLELHRSGIKTLLQSIVYLASFAQHWFWMNPHYCMCWYFIPFNYCVVFHCLDIPQIAYPFSCWWTFGLLWTFVYKSFCRHLFPFVMGK